MTTFIGHYLVSTEKNSAGGQIKRKIFVCKKKTTSSIWPKSKIPDMQVVQMDITHNLYKRDF